MSIWQYQARVLRITDGDTQVFRVDQGFGQNGHTSPMRLLHVNTPEMHKKTFETGLAATRFVVEWLGLKWNKDEVLYADEVDVVWWQDLVGEKKRGYHVKPGREPVVYIRSHDERKVKQGGRGRWLVEVYKDTSFSGQSLNEALLEHGHAVPY